MTPFKHILVGTDFSPRSFEALDMAFALAEFFQARLTLVHALPEVSLNKAIEEAPSYNPTDQPVYTLRRWLDTLLNERAQPGIETRSMVALGQPAERMVALTRDLDVDLVVVAPTGKKLHQRLVFGSTAEALIKGSSAPIWFAPPGRPAGLGRFVAGLDYSDATRPTVQVAADMSCLLGARLDLVHVAKEMGQSTVDTASALSGGALIRTEAQTRFESWCEEHIDKRDDCTSNLHLILRQGGSASKALLDHAESTDADVIVVGTHKHSALYEAFIGSTARQIMPRLPCHMLVTRSPA